MSEPQQTPPAQGNGRSKGRRRGLVGPVILIAIGIIFLLQNFDLLPWDVWTVIWRGWPAILILVGLDMLIGRRSGWGTFIVLVLAALLIWAVLSGAGRGGGGTTTIPFAQKLEGATSAEVRIASGIASLRIEASDDRDALAEGTIQETSLHPVTRSFQKSGETARFTLGVGDPEDLWWPGDWDRPSRWDIRLGRGVPIRLIVNTGIGKATLDLSELDISGLDVHSGVGETSIKLPARGRMAARIHAGIGEVVIAIPRSMAARLRFDTGLGSVRVPAEYRQEGEKGYVSPLADAANMVDLDVDGGIGGITIKEIS